MIGGIDMGKIIGFIVVVFIVTKFTNHKIDSSRVKKWWDEE